MFMRWQHEAAVAAAALTDRAFYRLVRRHGRLASDDQARNVTRQVFAGLATGLTDALARDLQRCLPPTPAAELAAQRRQQHGTAAGDGFDREQFIGPLVSTMDTVGLYDETLGGMDLVSAYLDDDAAMQVQAVFVAVKGCCGPDLAAQLVQGLPDEVSDWFRNATRS